METQTDSSIGENGEGKHNNEHVQFDNGEKLTSVLSCMHHYGVVMMVRSSGEHEETVDSNNFHLDVETFSKLAESTQYGVLLQRI
jgi:hypothetical protein